MRIESVVAPAPLRRSLAVGSLRGVLARHWASILVSAGAVVWGLAFALLAADRHRTFLSARFDLGNMVQAVWNTAHGRFLETTTADGIQLTRVGVHVDPLLALFAPAWWVWPARCC